MQPASESRTVLIATAIGIVILILFVLSLGAVVLVSRTGTDVGSAEATATEGGVVAAETATPGGGTTTQSTALVAAATPAPRPTATTRPVAPTATSVPPSPTTKPVAPTATPVPPSPTSVPPSPTATSAPAVTPTPALAAGLGWPDALPTGMTFAAQDSWPFRVIAPDRAGEPFLIFRGGSRWLLIRGQSEQDQPIPRSVTTSSVQIGGASATLIKYQGNGFKLTWNQDGLPIEMSGDGVSDADLTRTAASLRLLNKDELRARLNQEAASRKFHVTLLWPNVLPQGVSLATSESSLQLAAPVTGPQADSYRVVFRGGATVIQIGGGSTAAPSFTGTEQRITSGSLTGVLTSADRRFLLVVDGPTGSSNLSFPESSSTGQGPLPLVQQGRVFVSAENVDRAQFDQVIANLQPLLPQIFQGQVSGQNLLGIDYRWPANLPAGYTVDLTSTKVSFDDFVLQGGLPFFVLTVTGPNGKVTIRGGHESNGTSITVPEGPDVQRSTPNIHGNLATAAQSPDGSVVVWSEGDVVYDIDSPSVTVDQLVTIGQGLQPISAAEFFKRIQ